MVLNFPTTFITSMDTPLKCCPVTQPLWDFLETFIEFSLAMRTWFSFGCSIVLTFFCNFILFNTCFASIRNIGQIKPGFYATQMHYIDIRGLFLVSNNSVFAFGFSSSKDDDTLFLLSIIHLRSSKIVWSANRGTYVANSDFFVFDSNGNAHLEGGKGTIWSTDTTAKGVTAMELQDSGNLVLLGKDRNILWQSFSHPTDTLLSGQKFIQGMRLVSNNLRYYLEINSGDMLLYINSPTPQPYWSIAKELRKRKNSYNVSGSVSSATLVSGSWDFFDQTRGRLWRFIFTADMDPHAMRCAVLDNNGVISFYNLEGRRRTSAEWITIPQGSCSFTNVKMKFQDARLYFEQGFVPPFFKANLDDCKDACLRNCSCVLLFFETRPGNCYLYDQIGSFNSIEDFEVVSYIKVRANSDYGKGHIVVIIVIFSALVIMGLLIWGLCFFRIQKIWLKLFSQESDEDSFLESVRCVPLRFSYKELEDATNCFTFKLGQGGFGSVYQGKLKDGTEIAVKKLEGIGQGKKQFRAEVSIIGSIRHTHLVRLGGFCTEGCHRLLVYEYMANNSLDKWIYRRKADSIKLDWVTRFNIALGTAKGLAYLHEDCDLKIVHCDFKPENVLLDEHFHAKVSDFGLAKLMNRGQSHVFTTLRGTRGYLAPEWITNQAISEKSDVYSFGMVLLELIRGMRNFDSSETSERAHFPTYALKMAEEKKLHEIIDPYVEVDEEGGSMITAIQVALWCIQKDMHMRPSMSKVVQMLEGGCAVPELPTSSQPGSNISVSIFESSNTNFSAMLLSGPR